MQPIPGVGKSLSLDLWNIGIRDIKDLSVQSSRVLYEKLNALCGIKHDICLLYTFRCAVYFATEKSTIRINLIGGIGRTSLISISEVPTDYNRKTF